MEARVTSSSTLSMITELKRCGKMKDITRGKLLHSHLASLGCQENIYIASTLVSMYAKCGCMEAAREVFNRMNHRNVVSWNVLISGYLENGESLVALETFNVMDCAPDRVTFVIAAKACAALATGEKLTKEACRGRGLTVHRLASQAGLDRNVVVASTLVDMYSKCSDMVQARGVFDRMIHRNVISWNVLVFGYVENGDSSAALDVFARMDCPPDAVTFVAALKACAGLGTNNGVSKEECLEKGRSIHRQARELEFDKDVVVASTLVDMYSKCGDMAQARVVFESMSKRNVVAWTALILGYLENGESLRALEVFDGMDCEPDFVIFVAAAKACARVASEKGLDKEACLRKGESLHAKARKLGFHRDILVANTLVDMYSKCGDMSQARGVFDGMVNRTVVSWNVLIFGYLDNGESSMALEVFDGMSSTPNRITYVAAIKACASLGALRSGQRIHDQVCEAGLEQDEAVANSLVDFYAKCGNIAAAEDVFNRMKTHDTVSWTTLIGAYSLLGEISKLFSALERMKASGVPLDGVTMQLVLTACSHAGLLEEGRRYFDTMSTVYGVKVTVEHYACMVDILGRASKLEEALGLVRSMPFQGDSVVWTALLSACRKWSNKEIGRVAFEALVALNEDSRSVTGAYVLMRNIYRKLGLHREGEEIEAERRRLGDWKNREQTHWCDGYGGMHGFLVGDAIEQNVLRVLYRIQEYSVS